MMPTSDGFYWFQCNFHGLTIAKVYGFDASLCLDEPRFTLHGWDGCDAEPISAAKGQWGQRIEEPKQDIGDVIAQAYFERQMAMLDEKCLHGDGKS